MNLFTVLGVLFVALKLTGFIAWSWWLVLLPIYAGLILFIGAYIAWVLINAAK